MRTKAPGLTDKVLKRPAIPVRFKPKRLWVVPQGEELRFARYLGRPISSQPAGPSSEAVWVPEGGILLLDAWQQAYPAWAIMGLDREVVCSRSDVNEYWMGQAGFKDTRIGEFDDYVKTLATFLGIAEDDVDDGRVAGWRAAYEAWGWDGVYADLHHRVLGTDTEHHKRGRAFWEFLKQVAAAQSDTCLRSLWPLVDQHGEAEVYHAVLSFFDRAITWYADGNARLSRFYRELLSQFCQRHDASRVMVIARDLHNSHLPPMLRLVVALRTLDNANSGSRLPAAPPAAQSPTESKSSET